MGPALLALAAVAAALPAQPPPPPQARGDIVVTGRKRLPLRTFVDAVARPQLGHQIARWHEPICVRFNRVGEPYGSYIRARVMAAAGAVRLPQAGPKCQTNVLVVLNDEAEASAKVLIRQYEWSLGNATKRDANAFATPRPVRWLTANIETTSDGTSLDQPPFGDKFIKDSLIRTGLRENVVSKVILIDEKRLGEVTLRQLADYIAFVTLASPDIAADYSNTDSIMALFARTDDRPATMTPQDLAFLRALYASPVDRAAAVQKGAIRSRMRRALVAETRSADAPPASGDVADNLSRPAGAIPVPPRAEP